MQTTVFCMNFMFWFGLVQYSLIWYGFDWHGLIWFGLIWHILIWYGLEFYGSFWKVYFGSVICFALYDTKLINLLAKGELI